jgi:hypothetical protein
VTPLGIDPEISRLVAQCLNHYATPGPYLINIFVYYITVYLQNLIKDYKKNTLGLGQFTG